MKVPNSTGVWRTNLVSLSRLQNEGSQHTIAIPLQPIKSIKATE